MKRPRKGPSPASPSREQSQGRTQDQGREKQNAKVEQPQAEGKRTVSAEDLAFFGTACTDAAASFGRGLIEQVVLKKNAKGKVDKGRMPQVGADAKLSSHDEALQLQESRDGEEVEEEPAWKKKKARKDALAKLVSGGSDTADAPRKNQEPLRQKRRRMLEEHEAAENQPENYEERPRKITAQWEGKEEKRQLLPVKDLSGKVMTGKSVKREQPKKQENEEEDEEEEEGDGESADEDGDANHEEELKEERHRGGAIVKALEGVTGFIRVARAKELIAELAERVLGDPEASIGQLKDLLGLCFDADDATKKAGLMGFLVVIKDIMPGYAIRERKEKPTTKGVKLSKEVEESRRYESTLLHQYGAYVRLLGKIKSSSTHGKVATRCLCTLIKSASHFNHFPLVVKAVVPRMNSKLTDISAECCKAVREVFEADPSGEASLEVVRHFTHIAKGCPQQISAQSMSTMLSLKLSEAMTEIDDGKVKKKSYHQIKKMKKRGTYEKEVERELKESEAEADRKSKSRVQTTVLRMVFTMWFRFLKQTPDSPTFPIVLAGVAKFAHLISVDFMGDLIKSLQVVMAATDVPHGTALSAVLAVLKLVKMHGAYLNIDLKEVHTLLYSRLAVALQHSDLREEFSDEIHVAATLDEARIALSRSAVECLQHLLINRGQMNTDRAAGFVRHLLTCAQQAPAHVALAILGIVHGLMLRFPKLSGLMDIERGSFGQYRPDVADPEYCNALSSTAWDISLLASHYHPTVASFAKSIASVTTPADNLGTTPALDLYRTFCSSSSGSFDLRPAMELSKSKLEKKSSKRRPLMMPLAPVGTWLGKQAEHVPPPDFSSLLA